MTNASTSGGELEQWKLVQIHIKTERPTAQPPQDYSEDDICVFSVVRYDDADVSFIFNTIECAEPLPLELIVFGYQAQHFLIHNYTRKSAYTGLVFRFLPSCVY